MPRGSRPGERRGGRTAGIPNKRTARLREAMQDAAERLGATVPADTLGRDAYGLMRAVYQDTRLPIEVRLDAAKAAIRFEMPRRRAVAVTAPNPLAGMTETQADGLRRLAEQLSGAGLLVLHAKGNGRALCPGDDPRFVSFKVTREVNRFW